MEPARAPPQAEKGKSPLTPHRAQVLTYLLSEPLTYLLAYLLKKELPTELKTLAPQQKKALHKIAQGEVLDVKMSGVNGESAGAGGEERAFVAFNFQIRTLQYGWRDALGQSVSQLSKLSK